MDVIILQVIFGISLFFIINWIGKHSFSIGYREINLFVSNEDAPALNFLIRVLSPIVYILILAALLYSFQLDKFVVNFYLVNIYYIIFRLLFNLVTERGILMNWFKQIIYWISIATISILVYNKIIRYKHNLLPDFTSMANEIWIIVLVFIFQLLNSLQLSNEGAERRRNAYLVKKYKYFKAEYGRTIKNNTKNEAIEIIAYAILIYEDFNRPKVARWLEYAAFYFTNKLYSLGVMQFPTRVLINDKESVDLGTKKLRETYEKAIESGEANFKQHYEFKSEIISKYNGGSKYYSAITGLTDEIKAKFYQNSSDVLSPYPRVEY